MHGAQPRSWTEIRRVARAIGTVSTGRPFICRVHAMGEPYESTWWSRHWKWIVPLVVLTPVLICGGAVTLLVKMVLGEVRGITPYHLALERAEADPEVINAIGTPIEPGFFFNGSYQVSGQSGHADLSIPVNGPRGHAVVDVVAIKHQGRWIYETMHVTIGRTGQRVDLLGDLPTDPDSQAASVPGSPTP